MEDCELCRRSQSEWHALREPDDKFNLERETYIAEEERFSRRYGGGWVCIKGDLLIGPYLDVETAYQHAVKFLPIARDGTFLLQQIGDLVYKHYHVRDFEIAN
jgi:hypothetical protein